ncbi:hypothetical protein KC19_10G163600 [Ceratodon purpureus]|uniref:Uncharacterized protein n=1 Tax=Ceratodon purpureus TaxID=3225 RepID=A0A8T0GTC2_CERPU|nr:hypothetical protein KC19_10G163600 [Ceratodon purpureus]
MGMWDEMCVACGGPLFAPDKECFDTEGLSETEAKYIDSLSFEDSKWLDDRVGITESEERVPLGQETGYGSFDLDESTYFCAATVFKHMTPSDEGYIYGLTCHTKCLELLERDLHYTLRFQDVWPMLMRQ